MSIHYWVNIYFFYIVLHFTFVLLESELTLVSLSKLKSLAFFVELYVNIKYECIDSLSRPAADRQLFFEVGTFRNFYDLVKSECKLKIPGQ